MTTTPAPAPYQRSCLDAARLLLSRLGVSPADLLAAPQDRDPVPTFAEYIPIVSEAVTDGPSTRRAVPDARLAEINHVAATTGNDPALDPLLLRLHTETACRLAALWLCEQMISTPPNASSASERKGKLPAGNRSRLP